MQESIITVDHLTKIYKLYDKPIDRVKESLQPFSDRKYGRDFYALHDVSFEVKKGETIGIIGKNGSGKSTLLKILARVLNPTSGNVNVTGKVSALLELGTGFNPEYTGIENVYFLGIGNVLYGVDADIKGIHDDRHEHIRRLAEVAHLMLDAGMIFIVTAIDLSQKELELIKTTVDSDCIHTVWVGKELPSNIQFDVVIENPDIVEDAITRLTMAISQSRSSR